MTYHHLPRSGDDYAGEYHYNRATGVTTGCPARAAIIIRLLKMVKAKDGQKGAAATRHHAEAMRSQDLLKIMVWSASHFPVDYISTQGATESAGRLALLSEWLKHVEMRAFLSTGFTLWTRYVFNQLSCISL
jgi:hypothetical protein